MGTVKIINLNQIDNLLKRLNALGYQLIGPTIRDNAIVYDKINGIADLPVGWTDKHDQGSYRLEKRKDKALFGYNLGPYTWKKFLFPPEQPLFSVDKSKQRVEIKPKVVKPEKLALVGVRACELNAIKIQDKVFSNEIATDTGYKARRENIFILAVNCIQVSDSCFCSTMGTGPKAETGFDLALTEIIESEAKHYFVLEVGSNLGKEVVEKLPLTDAQDKEIRMANKISEKTNKQMKVRFDNNKIKESLRKNPESKRWEDVEKRCLSCANCTMVCPTCFCTAVEDSTNLDGSESNRSRKWDSCFNIDFSYMHGGPIRSSTKSRYRQWLTHKLSTWHEQFGTSGCVGCGRCITWCPTGIDITEEAIKVK